MPDEKEPYANSFSGMDTALVLIFRGDGFNRNTWLKISREFFVWNWPAWSCARFLLPVACARFFHVRFCALPWWEHVSRSWLRQAPSCALLWLYLTGAVAEGAVSAALAKPVEARNMEVNSKVAIFFMVNALSGQVKSHMACIQPGRYCINRKPESGYGLYPIIR